MPNGIHIVKRANKPWAPIERFDNCGGERREATTTMKSHSSFPNAANRKCTSRLSLALLWQAVRGPNCTATIVCQLRCRPTDAAKLIVRNGIGRPNVATPTLFRDLRKQHRSFRPKRAATSAVWPRIGLMSAQEKSRLSSFRLRNLRHMRGLEAAPRIRLILRGAQHQGDYCQESFGPPSVAAFVDRCVVECGPVHCERLLPAIAASSCSIRSAGRNTKSLASEGLYPTQGLGCTTRHASRQTWVAPRPTVSACLRLR